MGVLLFVLRGLFYNLIPSKNKGYKAVLKTTRRLHNVCKTHGIILSGAIEGDISLRETFKEGFDRVLNTKIRYLSTKDDRLLAVLERKSMYCCIKDTLNLV